MATPRQFLTFSDTDLTVTPQQEQAVALLIAGKTHTDVGRDIDVCRQTVSEWYHHHPGFQARLNQARAELWDGTLETMRQLVPKALKVLTEELDNPVTRLQAAVHLLKACGAYGVPLPQGKVDPEEIGLEEKRRQQDKMYQSLAMSE